MGDNISESEALGQATPVGSDGKTAPRRKWRRRLVVLVLLLAVAISVPFLHNNFGLSQQSRTEMEENLRECMGRAHDLIDSHSMSLSHYKPNAALLYMIHDMAKMMEDSRLEKVIRIYLIKCRGLYWNRLVFNRYLEDLPDELEDLPQEHIQSIAEDTRWFYYAVGGDKNKLSDKEQSRLFSPTACTTRDLTHQLMALALLRERGIEIAGLDTLIDTVCQRIAYEARLDFRVSDMYIQRVAFLFAANRPDLVRRRWVEKIIAFQQADGGWCFPYLPRAIKPLIGGWHSVDHTTVQAAWALTMIDRRFPEWLDQHYTN